jgi:hypothetical protein
MAGKGEGKGMKEKKQELKREITYEAKIRAESQQMRVLSCLRKSVQFPALLEEVLRVPAGHEC